MGNEQILKLHEIAVKTIAQLREDFPQYNFTGITLKWSNRMTRAAGNASSRRVIKLSVPIWQVEENEHDFVDTVLHEVAHILAGVREMHGPKWKRIARELGCTARRCHQLQTPERKTISHPCSICGEPMELGPIRWKKAQRGWKYRHGHCKPPKKTTTQKPIFWDLFPPRS